MSTETAHVGLWAAREMDEITVHLGSGSNWDESSPVGHLPESEEYYLTQLKEFAQERLQADALFEDLPKYEPTRIGEFTINGESR